MYISVILDGVQSIDKLSSIVFNLKNYMKKLARIDWRHMAQMFWLQMRWVHWFRRNIAASFGWSERSNLKHYKMTQGKTCKLLFTCFIFSNTSINNSLVSSDLYRFILSIFLCTYAHRELTGNNLYILHMILHNVLEIHACTYMYMLYIVFLCWWTFLFAYYLIKE